MINGELLATMQAARLEFGALMTRPARLADPADEARPREAEAEALGGPLDDDRMAEALEAIPEADRGVAGLPAAWQALQPATVGKARRRSAVRRQPLAPLAPLQLADDSF